MELQSIINNKRFKIMQVNPTQCGIRDTLEGRNIVFSENYDRLKKVCDELNDLSKDKQRILSIINHKLQLKDEEGKFNARMGADIDCISSQILLLKELRKEILK